MIPRNSNSVEEFVFLKRCELLCGIRIAFKSCYEEQERCRHKARRKRQEQGRFQTPLNRRKEKVSTAWNCIKWVTLQLYKHGICENRSVETRALIRALVRLKRLSTNLQLEWFRSNRQWIRWKTKGRPKWRSTTRSSQQHRVCLHLRGTSFFNELYRENQDKMSQKEDKRFFSTNFSGAASIPVKSSAAHYQAKNLAENFLPFSV